MADQLWFMTRIREEDSAAFSSVPSALFFGISRGSDLEPTSFLFYTADLLQLIKGHHVTSHAYADDTEMYGHCQSSNAGSLAQWVSICIYQVSVYMTAKIDVLCLVCITTASTPDLHWRHLVSPVTAIGNLDVYTDATSS